MKPKSRYFLKYHGCIIIIIFQLEYRVPGGLDRIRQRYLQATVWNYDTLQENEFFGGTVIKLSDIDLSQETTQWYPLGNVHR